MHTRTDNEERGSSCYTEEAQLVEEQRRYGLGFVWIPAFGGKYFCPAKAVSGNSDTIRQTEEKFREYGSHGMWISVATYVKCQQTLAGSNYTVVFFLRRAINPIKPKPASNIA